MLIYNMTIDSAMSTNNVEIFWTNRRYGNKMNFTFQSIFSPSTLNLPDKPGYIPNFALGITQADISVTLTDFNGNSKYEHSTVYHLKVWHGYHANNRRRECRGTDCKCLYMYICCPFFVQLIQDV